jgi:hypothetical protein
VSDLTESHVALARITDALFCSELATDDQPTIRQLAAAIREALRTHRNWNVCTRAVAAAFTTNPQEAERREAWCRSLADEALKAADHEPDADVRG